MKLKTFAAGLALALSGVSAHSAVVTSTFNNVTILGSLYNVTFHQDSDGITTFNDVFGTGGPTTLPFNVGNAAAAAGDLLAALNAADYDPTPGSNNPTFVAFALIVDFNDTAYTYRTGFRNTPGNGAVGVFGPFNLSRNDILLASIPTFERVTATPVPAPGTLALAALAVLALRAARRR